MGAYYVRENDSHGYTEVCLPAEAAALATKDLLESSNNVGGWKAIIRQLVDQSAAGEVEPQEEAARAACLAEFANRVLKTPFATTPMRATRRRGAYDSDDNNRLSVWQSALTQTLFSVWRTALDSSEGSWVCVRQMLAI